MPKTSINARYLIPPTRGYYYTFYFIDYLYVFHLKFQIINVHCDVHHNYYYDYFIIILTVVITIINNFTLPKPQAVAKLF